MAETLIVRTLGMAEYEPTWRAMQVFTAERVATTPDELWLLQHPAVYTLGLSCREPLETGNNIPQVHIDRGGKMTYHGPGQLVVYFLLDMKRKGIGIRFLVNAIEQSVIDMLAEYSIIAERRAGAPGVYVNGAKIAALGLKVKKGCTYHGLSINIDMDLSPFAAIDPCGYPGLKVTQMSDLGALETLNRVGLRLLKHMKKQLGYENASIIGDRFSDQ